MSLRDQFIQTRPLPIALIACAALGSPLLAQDTPRKSTGERPAAAGRVVRAFDFEEQDYNPLPVPMGWIRAQEDPAVPRVRPGFPIWNGGVLDYKSPAYSGRGSAYLPTSGGSTSLVLRKGELNIFPNADYLISVRVKTGDLKYAKGALVARLLDQRGEEIEGGRVSTEMVNTNGRWQQISVEIEGVYQDAAFVEIELLLLQPMQQLHEGEPDPFTVWDQDFHGGVWFDNLIVAQLPRLEITTGIPGNLVESEDVPALQILVRDLTGDQIVARARVFDVHGEEVDSQVFDSGERRVRSDWKPALPGYGWYRAVLEVSVGGRLVGLRRLDFVWSSPSKENLNSGMFSIHAKLTDPKIAESAGAIISGAGVTRASLEVWNNHTTRNDIAPDSVAMRAINELIGMGTNLSIVISQLPAELAAALAVDPEEVLAVFAGPSSEWVQWGSSMFDQYGQAVPQWRFSEHATQEDASVLTGQLDAIGEALVGYVPGPILTIPWAIDRPIEDVLVRPSRELLIIDNNTTGEEAMGLIVEDWSASASRFSADHPDGAPALGIVMSPLHEPGSVSGVEVWSSVGALARKAISFWWAASSTGLGNDHFDLELRDAWWVSKGKRGQVMPAPELVVWKTLATHLGGRVAIEEIELIPGVKMLVAGSKPGADHAVNTGDGAEGGAIVLWLDDPMLVEVSLNMPVSMGDVFRFDVFNNKTPVVLDHLGDLGLPVHRIMIGRSPIIVTGVNTNLVRFLAGIKLTPGSLEAKSGIHRHALELVNPFEITIRGRVFIVEPGGYTGEPEDIDRSWEVRPRVIEFVLDPYESKGIPVEIAYSIGEIAGEKALVFDVELQGDQEYPLIRMRHTIELNLEAVEMLLSARKANDGITVVSVKVINKLESVQSYELIAIPPNESRLRRSINGLAPSEKAIREFAFTKAKPGEQIVITLMLGEGSTRLNKSITVP